MILARVGQNVTPLYLADLYPADVNCGTTARFRSNFLLAVGLQPAHPAAQPGWQQFEFIANLKTPIRQRAGDYGAKARHGKDPIHWQARPAQVWSGGGLFQQERQH
jgi:hypothetical protein